MLRLIGSCLVRVRANVVLEDIRGLADNEEGIVSRQTMAVAEEAMYAPVGVARRALSASLWLRGDARRARLPSHAAVAPNLVATIAAARG